MYVYVCVCCWDVCTCQPVSHLGQPVAVVNTEAVVLKVVPHVDAGLLAEEGDTAEGSAAGEKQKLMYNLIRDTDLKFKSQ